MDDKSKAMVTAFTAVFGLDGKRSIEQRVVMAWMKRFCRARQSTFSVDARAHAVAEGRREVLLEIERRLYEPDETIEDILGMSPTTEEDDHE